MDNESASKQAAKDPQSSKENARSEKNPDKNLHNANDGAKGHQPVSSTQASNATPDA